MTDTYQPTTAPTPDQMQQIYNLLSYLASAYEEPVGSLADAHQKYDELAMSAHNLCVDLGIPYDDAEAEEDMPEQDDEPIYSCPRLGCGVGDFPLSKSYVNDECKICCPRCHAVAGLRDDEED